MFEFGDSGVNADDFEDWNRALLVTRWIATGMYHASTLATVKFKDFYLRFGDSSRVAYEITALRGREDQTKVDMIGSLTQQSYAGYKIVVTPNTAHVQVEPWKWGLYSREQLLAWMAYFTQIPEFSFQDLNTSSVLRMYSGIYKSVLSTASSYSTDDVESGDWRGQIANLYRANLMVARFADEDDIESAALPILIQPMIGEALKPWFTVTTDL